MTIDEFVLAIIVAIIGSGLLVNFINKIWIAPYQAYRKEELKTKIDLAFYSHIITNAFTKDECNPAFIEEVSAFKKRIRKRWSRLSMKYTYVPWMFRHWMPDKMQMAEIEQSLIYFSNRNYFKPIGDECSECTKRLYTIMSSLNTPRGTRNK